MGATILQYGYLKGNTEERGPWPLIDPTFDSGDEEGDISLEIDPQFCSLNSNGLIKFKFKFTYNNMPPIDRYISREEPVGSVYMDGNLLEYPFSIEGDSYAVNAARQIGQCPYGSSRGRSYFAFVLRDLPFAGKGASGVVWSADVIFEYRCNSCCILEYFYYSVNFVDGGNSANLPIFLNQ
jgi:hypothetical protein